MSDQTELEKSADPNAQNPSQPPVYQTEPPQGQYPPAGQYLPPEQKYPPTDQYPPQGPPQGQYPPPGQQYPPTAHYDHQQASVTVVTTQPIPAATRYVANQRAAAPDYLTVTIAGLVICFFCGGVLGLLLVPALICSIKASNANNSGDYDSAKKFGQASLACNVGVYIFNTLAIIASVVTVVVVVVQANQVNIICGTGGRLPPPCIGRG